MWKRIGIAIVACALLGVVLANFGCTAHRAYRVPNGEIALDDTQFGSDDSYRSAVESHCVEVLQTGSANQIVIGYVEFDDQGEFWDVKQWSRFRESVLAHHRGRDVVLVTFVHGWKHNASVCDSNVTCFREVLKSVENSERLFAQSSNQPARPVVGLYVGWRGLSATPPVIKETSFYARKAAAHRVGNGRLRDLLVAAELLRHELGAGGADRTRLIIVGHSFGAAATFSALGAIFQERIARHDSRNGGDRVIEGFGDGVVLVNPAFEATLYSGLHALAGGHDRYSTHQRAVLLTVSSETDSATQKAFPLGRFFGTLFEKTRDAEQKKALRTTLGNYENYRTHFLEEAPAGVRSGWLDDIRELDPQQKSRAGTECKCPYLETMQVEEEVIAELASRERAVALQSDGSMHLGDTVLRPVNGNISAYAPLIVARASDALVTQHNGIYNAKFLDFLRLFLVEMEQRARPPAPDPDGAPPAP